MSENHSALPETNDNEKKRMTFTRWVLLGSAIPGGIVLILFLLGLVLGLIDADYWGPRISSVRDLFIIIVAFEFILIIAAITVLILQVARLINLLQNEVKPILDNTKETVDTARGTAQFVGKNVTQPLVRASGWFAGLRIFVRELGGIRRALKRSNKQELQAGDQ
ncbi:MAG: hypothetical protein RLP44_02690 [Aggregatilineales bacterium]